MKNKISGRINSAALFLMLFLLSTSTVWAQPVPVATNTGPICTGGVVTLSETGTGAVSWTWTSNGTAVIDSPTAQSTTASGAVDGEIFTVKVKDSGDLTAEATTTVTVVADPSITTNPVSPTDAVCVGGTLSALTVTGTGGTPTLLYQWYSNTTNTTTGSTLITGATTNSYTPPTTTAGTMYYYCVVSATGSGCGTATSTIASVVVVADPSITTNPVSPTDAVCVGGTLSALTVTGTGGTPTLLYQWYSNTTNTTTGSTLITGATTNSYTPPTTTAGTMYYYCVVSATGSGCGTAISTIASVVVVADPSITTNPVSPTDAVCVGGTLSALTVTGTGGTPTLLYQWYSNTINSSTGGTLIAGASTASYTPLTATAGTIYYYCIVSASGSGCGTATSTTASVTVIADPAITANPISPDAVCIGGTL